MRSAHARVCAASLAPWLCAEGRGQRKRCCPTCARESFHLSDTRSPRLRWGASQNSPTPARVGRLSMRGASWLHRGSNITFVPRGHVRACHSQSTCLQRAEQDCSSERVSQARTRVQSPNPCSCILWGRRVKTVLPHMRRHEFALLGHQRPTARRMVLHKRARVRHLESISRMSHFFRA
jgi:hypothetical protein